ncbi:MAG: esterase-like activity of phytase family protein [Aquabacterium sp.]|nr:esterase-like activity of phytase family protein [Aquabacterium sp.]
MTSPTFSLKRPLAACALLAAAALAHAAPTLVGFARMPAGTFADGPTSGQFQSPANGVTPPYVARQPVQGFSAVLFGPRAGTFYVMPDNGFGTKPNSPDYLLRMYAVEPDFRRAVGRHGRIVGSGEVKPVALRTGWPLRGFEGRHAALGRITLSDPDRLIGFPIVADAAFYPYAGTGPGRADIPVDAAIREQRLLTGGDLDIEAVRQDRHGNLWFGDEFGPFLVKTDRHGRVLRAAIPLPNSRGYGGLPLVQSPQSPLLADAAQANLRGSNGFEGLAINPAGTTLYALLEGALIPDADQKRLLINEFDIEQERYTGRTWAYRLEAGGTNIGDMTAINDHEFLVIERNGIQGTQPNAADMFKKIYRKTEVVDLLKIADPNDLDGDGRTTFDFPFVTIEDVLPVDERTLLVINDNNFPGNGGRTTTAPDATEFILVRLDEPLRLQPRSPLCRLFQAAPWCTSK